MLLLLFQILLISWFGKAEQKEEGGQKNSIRDMFNKYLGELEGVGKKPERPVVSLMEMKIKQDFPRGPRFMFPDTNRRDAVAAFRKDAKKFWDLFKLKTKSRSEEVILPIKISEIHQEVCNKLPFSQSITHENCDRVVIQNNVCFGKCSSFHVPGADDRFYSFCSLCMPTKFSMKHLKMNCTMINPVNKMVMIIEECKCEVQNMEEMEQGLLHPPLYSNEP
ncbi:cerberus isoform X2 [Erythrolamprus reginae]|uniref:cerberus isoform X2 n=1 Tax=Erythrolamprus reginae TaxID=121349 RepID=UPI00396CF790